MENKDLIDTLRAAMVQALANTHTITVARVTKVNAKTISCRPVINRVVDGGSIALPEFVEVPPVFLQGGSSYLAHPITVGDYCLLLFAERCFDQWYAGRDFTAPPELRMHDYSDGFALVGVNPLAAAIAIPSIIQLIGDANFEGNHTHTGNVERTGTLTQTGNADVTGDVNITGAADISGLLTVGSLAITTTITIGGSAGVSGTFTSADGKTITVTNGIITSIV